VVEFSTNTGTGAESIPVPVNVNEKLVLDTSLVTNTALAVFAPLVPGVKRIVKVALAAGDRLAGGGVEKLKHPALAPLKPLDDIARATLPLLVAVKLTSA
jgi:hypothetical protein